VGALEGTEQFEDFVVEPVLAVKPEAGSAKRFGERAELGNHEATRGPARVLVLPPLLAA